MANLVISSSQGSATFVPVAVDAQGSANRYWLDVYDGGAQYRVEEVKAPGQSGSKIKRHGFDQTPGYCIVAYIAGSASTCRGNRTSDEGKWMNANCTVAVPDGPSLTNCLITSTEKLDGPRECETGNYIMRVRINFKRVRL